MSRYRVLLSRLTALHHPLRCLYRSPMTTSRPCFLLNSRQVSHSPGATPLAGDGSTGRLTDDADVCIIGAGITGASSSYHLSNAFRKALHSSLKTLKICTPIQHYELISSFGTTYHT
ncbi:hypothetical protein B0H15DRAFT_796943 [Mycena belliarum]|uniref:FAD dependent oxidoreductase domain-containing protein n=1 Tax=Mycena belliarum TaxID=1033014 RepID=A0AAD6UJN1_9AGAR|nr:hypothetical protein B0H15DRAFT_796943 [Mycena belliae]